MRQFQIGDIRQKEYRASDGLIKMSMGICCGMWCGLIITTQRKKSGKKTLCRCASVRLQSLTELQNADGGRSDQKEKDRSLICRSLYPNRMQLLFYAKAKRKQELFRCCFRVASEPQQWAE